MELGLALLAILGTNVHQLEVGRIPNSDELYAEAINQAMMERLRRIHAAGGETETGVIVVPFLGYISGIQLCSHRSSAFQGGFEGLELRGETIPKLSSYLSSQAVSSSTARKTDGGNNPAIRTAAQLSARPLSRAARESSTPAARP